MIFLINLLNKHGLLKSNFSNGIHNFIIIKYLNQKSFKKYNNNKFYNLNKYQKIYLYDISNYLLEKDILYKNYLNMKIYFNKDFNYMPETYYYPEHKKLIKAKFKKYRKNISNLWLIKPKNKFGGIGIFIFKSLKKIKTNEYIITKYITNINLIHNKKYDLRLYVLVTGLRPLRIYFYKEGLVRIASEN